MEGNPDSRICEIFFLWNLESWSLESEIQLKESGIPLTIGIQTQVLLKRNLEYGIQNAAGIQIPRLDYLT